MYYLFALILAATLAQPLHAQDEIVQDTLDWRGYYPLEIGNVWEWETTILYGYHATDRREITADTTIGGRRYYVQVGQHASSDGLTGTHFFHRDTTYVRYDTLTSRIMARRPNGDEEWAYTCDLSAAFGAVAGCLSGDSRHVAGGYSHEEAVLRVGEDEVPYEAYKALYDLGGTTHYYYGVGALPGLGDGNMGSRSFTYLRLGDEEYGQRLLFPPRLLLPEEDGPIDTSAAFTWRAASGAAAYQLQISRDSTRFRDLVRDTTVADTTFRDELDEPDGWYHWRVRSVSAEDTSRWSPAQRFYLKVSVSTEPTAAIPARLSLEARYPNPAGTSVTFTFTLGHPASVRLEIIDALGRRIRLHEAGYLQSGSHTLTLRQLPEASGLYLVRLSAGDHAETIPLTVAR